MKKIVIIGGGIAGLSTGCYAQLSGFQSEIYEANALPGGVCASWKRGEYLFDHCLHWVLGSKKGTSISPVFEELGITENIAFHHPEVFRAITLGDKTLTAYTDLDKFERELLRLFPDEKKGIGRYTSLIRKYAKFNPPLDGDIWHMGMRAFLKFLTFMPSFMKLLHRDGTAFLNGLFKNPDLREMLFQLFPVKGMPALMTVMPFGFMHARAAGYPMGGSLHFARTIENKYKTLGGKPHYGRKVKKIIVEGDRARGIELEDGTVVPADIVISACDGRSVLYDMLAGRYLSGAVRKLYDSPELWPPILSISLGINRDFSDCAEITGYKLSEPVSIGGNEIRWTGFFHYCHDPAFAPRGKSVVQAQIETDYSDWKSLYEKDRTRYRAEKERVLAAFIKILDEKFPGIEDDIEESDVATPVTWERWTGNWRGSYEGWLPTVKKVSLVLPKKLPGLRDFYMTGQWVFPGGGAPVVAVQGRNIIKQVVRDNR